MLLLHNLPTLSVPNLDPTKDDNHSFIQGTGTRTDGYLALRTFLLCLPEPGTRTLASSLKFYLRAEIYVLHKTWLPPSRPRRSASAFKLRRLIACHLVVVISLVHWHQASWFRCLRLLGRVFFEHSQWPQILLKQTSRLSRPVQLSSGLRICLPLANFLCPGPAWLHQTPRASPSAPIKPSPATAVSGILFGPGLARFPALSGKFAAALGLISLPNLAWRTMAPANDLTILPTFHCSPRAAILPALGRRAATIGIIRPLERHQRLIPRRCYFSTQNLQLHCSSQPLL